MGKLPPEDQVFHIKLRHDGIAQDYWRAGYAGVPILSPRARKFFETLEGVTVLPARIGDQPYEGYAILFVGHFRNCLDSERSDYVLFEENDPVRPALAGHIKSASKLCIDPEQTGNSDISRLSNGRNSIFVSDRVRTACLSLQFEGCSFESA